MMEQITSKKNMLVIDDGAYDDCDRYIKKLTDIKKPTNMKNHIIIDDGEIPENIYKRSKETVKSKDKKIKKDDVEVPDKQEELYDDLDTDLIVHKLLIKSSSTYMSQLFENTYDVYTCGYINSLFNKFILKICKTRSLKDIVGDEFDNYKNIGNRKLRHVQNVRIINKDPMTTFGENKNWEFDITTIIGVLRSLFGRNRIPIPSSSYKLYNPNVYKYIHEHFNYNFITEIDYMLFEHFDESPGIAFIIVCICTYFKIFLKKIHAGILELKNSTLPPILKFKKAVDSNSELRDIVEKIYNRYDKPILAPNAIDCHYKFA